MGKHLQTSIRKTLVGLITWYLALRQLCYLILLTPVSLLMCCKFPYSIWCIFPIHCQSSETNVSLMLMKYSKMWPQWYYAICFFFSRFVVTAPCSSDQRIPLESQCDGFVDCFDYSDETGCGEYIITAFTQCSDCGAEPQMRDQTRLLPLGVNANHLPRLRGSGPPFVLLQICRVRPSHAGSDAAFCCCVNRKLGLPPQCMELFHVLQEKFLLELVRSAPLAGSAPWVGSLCKRGSMKPPQDGSDPPPGFDPGIGALWKRGMCGSASICYKIHVLVYDCVMY